jgi:hypothetical protein
MHPTMSPFPFFENDEQEVLYRAAVTRKQKGNPRMRERPILFSGEMVRAILDGSKTQTRRVVKGEALKWLAPEMFAPSFVADPANGVCPFGYAGDRLWVRETFRTYEGITSTSWVGEEIEPFNDRLPLENPAPQMAIRSRWFGRRSRLQMASVDSHASMGIPHHA